MNVSFSSCAILFFKESILPTLTAQNKKILLIASAAIGFLAACYLAKRYCCCSFTYEPPLNGPGRKNWPCGVEEEGEFSNDILHGQGKRTYPSGTVKEGQFKDGELHGQGQRIRSDGTQLKGHFFRDRFKGGGQIIRPTGSITDIQFIDVGIDIKHSQAKIVYPNGSEIEIKVKTEGKGLSYGWEQQWFGKRKDDVDLKALCAVEIDAKNSRGESTLSKQIVIEIKIYGEGDKLEITCPDQSIIKAEVKNETALKITYPNGDIEEISEDDLLIEPKIFQPFGSQGEIKEYFLFVWKEIRNRSRSSRLFFQEGGTSDRTFHDD